MRTTTTSTILTVGLNGHLGMRAAVHVMVALNTALARVRRHLVKDQAYRRASAIRIRAKESQMVSIPWTMSICKAKVLEANGHVGQIGLNARCHVV